MDAWGLITGAIIATVTGVLIPFLTSEFSLRSKHRAQVTASRREALNRYSEESTRARMRALAANPAGGVRYEIAIANDEERQAAVTHLQGQFSLRDKLVYEVWSLPSSTDRTLILSSWANGERGRARRAARRLLTTTEGT